MIVNRGLRVLMRPSMRSFAVLEVKEENKFSVMASKFIQVRNFIVN